MGRLTRYGNFDVYCNVGYCPKDCNTCEMFKKIRERRAYYEELDTPRKPKYSNWEQDDDDEEFDLEYTLELEDVKILLSRMYDKIKELPIGTEISTSELLNLVSIEHYYKNGNYIYDGLVLETCDMFSIDYELKKEAHKYGITIDDTIHAGEVLGMPFNIGFLIKDYK